MGSGCSQFFENESEYHAIADETLEDIQDAVETVLEDCVIDECDHESSLSKEKFEINIDECEVVYASGVLTMTLAPHGTWVLNKQTPNRQIWWSSPISGPRRYEYDENKSEWIYTRSVSTSSGNEDTKSSRYCTDEDGNKEGKDMTL